MARAILPLGGTPGVFDSRNPTLIPNFDRVMASGSGTMDHASPAVYLQNNPRVDATVTVTVGGTITAGNVATLNINSGLISGGVLTVAYTIQTGDTTDIVAEALAALINENATAMGLDMSADLGGNGASSEIVVHQGGIAGNYTTLSSSVTGTITLTLGNSGAMAGGSGPVLATNNFTFSYNGSVSNFWAGQPYSLSADMVKQMVTQGMPIA